MDAGHPDARDYPIAMVWEELALVEERQNRALASEGTLFLAALSVGIGAFGKDGGRKAHAAFKKLIDSLHGELDHVDEADEIEADLPPSKRPRKR